MKAPEIEMVRVEDLKEWDRNPRHHGKGAGVRSSLERWGWVEFLVANRRDGCLISGHKRLSQARSLGQEVVPVHWVDLGPGEAEALGIALNKTGEESEWDRDRLADILGDLQAADALGDALGFELDELGDLLGDLGPLEGGNEEPGSSYDLEPAIGEGGSDDGEIIYPEDRGESGGGDEREPLPAPAMDAVVDSTMGAIYRLGRHFLRVGDSTDLAGVRVLLDAAGVKRVDAVITDPPYAIFGSSSGLNSSITDDKIVRPFFRGILRACESAVKMFGHVYVFCDWRSYASWWEEARPGRLEPCNCLVWDKSGSGLGSNWANTHELVLYLNHRPTENVMGKRQSGVRVVHRPNVFQFNRPHGRDRLHNAAKPVDLLSLLIEASTDEGETVLDLCGGSGSIVEACEAGGRIALVQELDPKNADLIRKRWTRYAREHGIDPGPGALEPVGIPT